MRNRPQPWLCQRGVQLISGQRFLAPASVPVLAVAADAVRGDVWQDTAVQAGEATQEESVVESSCTETGGDLPGVASQAKAAVGNKLRGAQPVQQQLIQPTGSFPNITLQPVRHAYRTQLSTKLSTLL